MPARIDLAELPPEVREQLGLTTPRARNGKRKRMAMDDVRTYAFRVLAVVASLTPAERRRVLAHAAELNEI